MFKKLVILAFAVSSALFYAPRANAQMNCWDGYIVNTKDGYSFCCIGSQNEGCVYCEVAPQCP
jgi:hypothetical protein